MTQLRIAVVGTGRWGIRIVETLRSLPERCEVIATVTHDYASLLQREDVDGVVIATPAKTHAAIASAFLRVGIPVFIEKPFTTRLADAEELVTLAARNGTSVFVGHIDLYNPAYQAMKAKLRDIGTITHIVAEAGSNGGARSDVSVLWDWTPHSIALVLDVLGRLPEHITATGDDAAFPTSVTLDLTFADGVTAHIENSWRFQDKRRRLTVIGTNGTAVYDDIVDQKTTPPLTAELTEWLTAVAAHTPIDATPSLNVVRVLAAAEAQIMR